MPHGVPESEETRAEFRARYLLSGNASESAREIGIPERTGRCWAQELTDDPSFAEDRRKLRASALQELVAMRLRVAQLALKRFEGDAPDPVVTEKGAVVPQDKRPEFGRLVLDAEKNAQHLAKFDADGERGADDGGPIEVVVNLKPRDGSAV